MAEFKDKNGKKWKIDLDAPLIRKVRKACNIDLGDLDLNGYQQITDDLLLLPDVLWALCSDQAGDSEKDEAAFYKAVTGDVSDHALAAILEAIIDFFPSAKREYAKGMAQKQEAARQIALDAMQKKLADPALTDRIKKAIDERMETGLERALTQLSKPTGFADSSESVPAE